MTEELTHYSLPRTGAPNLSFEGELLAQVQGEEHLPPNRRNPRWHDLSLYRTRGRKYVLFVSLISDWERRDGTFEPAHHVALVLESPDAVRAALAAHDPATGVEGFPPDPQFAKRQQKILDDIRTRYGRCVSDLFGQLGSEFSETVD
jgi:hypothetical protein